MSNPTLLTRFDAWLKHVGKSRDGILVVGGALYILGYIVWSINAYVNRLGLLPAFESQYFIAGIVPLVVIFLVCLLIRFCWTHNLHLPDWLNIWKGKWWQRIPQALIPFAVIVLNNFKGWEFAGKYFTRHRNLVGGIVAGIAGLLFILALFSKTSSDDSTLAVGQAGTLRKKLVVAARLMTAVAAIGAFGSVALYFYVGLLYSRLPQPLGGVRPRCAYLDIERAGLSKDTLRAILPPANQAPTPTPLATAAPTAEADIARSGQLEVLFSGSDYLLIRIGSEVFEIKRDVIHAVRSCD